MPWTHDDIPDLNGHRAVITGVTGGLGLHTAIGLARKGADLVVTARNPAKAEEAVARIMSAAPGAAVDVIALDLADLADTKRAAAEVSSAYGHIDILVNNAGIMVPPKSSTADGFELQIGTNHLGHFAWTAGLWPLLNASDARIVSVASLAHSMARGFDLRSLTPEGTPRRYRKWRSYGESKLANLMFALELDRRAKAAGSNVVSVASHPGYSSTNLTKTGPSVAGPSLVGTAMHQITRIVGQSAAAGARTSLRAATDPTLVGGEYIGPDGPGQIRGRPRLVGMNALARDEHLADEIWAASQAATAVNFPV